MDRLHHLIGQDLEWRPRFPWFGSLMALLGAAALALALMHGNAHWLLAALLPLAIALGLLLGAPGRVELTLEETGLRRRGEERLIPYAAIESLTIDGVSRGPEEPRLNGPLSLATADERLEIPPAGDRPVFELYLFLLERIPTSGKSPPEGPLETFRRQQAEEFGADRVRTFAARSATAPKPRSSPRWVWPLMIVTGIAWAGSLLAGDGFAPWIVGGVICSAVGAIGWAVAAAHRDPALRGIKHLDRAGLVIAPQGIALVHGDTQGKLRWDEIRQLRFNPRTRHFALSHAGTGAGLRIVVAGAEILIADIFDRPLAVIHDQLRLYWDGPE